MRLRLTIIFAVTTLVLFSAQAQHRNQKPVKSKTVQVSEDEIRRQQMVNSTQRIMIIDSVVVDKSQFLNAYLLSDEAGRLMPYHQLFGGSPQKDAFLYLNAMGNKCYFSAEDTTRLYTCDLLNGQWSSPAIMNISESENLSSLNYPFMMPDGVTLYFAAKGKESIGGYDIFITRYANEQECFLKPENVGMPFNSEANDFLLVVDEIDSIGYFATDRQQPENKVCIYTFIPTSSREMYSPDEYTAEEILRFSRIHRIADTWGDGVRRQQIMNRQKAKQQLSREIPRKPAASRRPSMSTSIPPFVVNDTVIYHRITDFLSTKSKTLYQSVTVRRTQLKNMVDQLDKARAYFVSATPEEQRMLNAEIRQEEAAADKIEKEIADDEKTIRNIENQLIKKKISQ